MKNIILSFWLVLGLALLGKTDVYAWEDISFCIGKTEIVNVSSTLSSETRRYDKSNIVDFDFSTAWCENGSPPHWITLRSASKEIYVNSLRVFWLGGYVKSRQIFNENDRPKVIKIVVMDQDGNVISVPGKSFTVNDVMHAQFFNVSLDKKINMASINVKIIIEDVYSGSKYDDMCVSEVSILPGEFTKLGLNEDEVISQELKIFAKALDSNLYVDEKLMNELFLMAHGIYFKTAEGGEGLSEVYLDLFVNYPKRFNYLLLRHDLQLQEKIYDTIVSPISDKYSDGEIYRAAKIGFEGNSDNKFFKRILSKYRPRTK